MVYPMKKPNAITLFGPTASGKTALAIHLATALNGVIINADSRQVYTHMDIITAMPTDEEFKAAPHRLFQYINPNTPFSAGHYLKEATKAAAEIIADGKCPIFVGGTGFYLKTLTDGISPIPEVPANILNTYNHRLKTEGAEALHAALTKVDPNIANNIETNDSQRIFRALTVWEFTKKPLSEWQKAPREGALPYAFHKLALLPARETVYSRIHQRFDIMMNAGLIDEMKNLHNMGFSENLPALKSLGIPEFFKWINEQTTFEEVKKHFLQTQRNYAKRQFTWAKNQYKADFELTKPHAGRALKWVKKIFNAA